MSPKTITKTCPICWEPFTTSGRASKRVYCSDVCKRRREIERAASRPYPGRRPTPTAPAPTAPPTHAPQPAAQRECPHCGGPITIVALLTTPEAARPTMPIAAPDGVIPIRR